MKNEIIKSVEVLLKGGIIIYPTDTFWGIGADATNYKAVSKVYKIKNRLKSDPMSVLIDSEDKLINYVSHIPDLAFSLLQNYPKPLTIIYPKGKNLSKNLIHLDGSVSIRISKDEFSKKLIEMLGKPIATTSANRMNEPPPLSFKNISPHIIKQVDYVVDLFHDSINVVKPSTIIRFDENNNMVIIRE